jgi:hypothetical protein
MLLVVTNRRRPATANCQHCTFPNSPFVEASVMIASHCLRLVYAKKLAQASSSSAAISASCQSLSSTVLHARQLTGHTPSTADVEGVGNHQGRHYTSETKPTSRLSYRAASRNLPPGATIGHSHVNPSRALPTSRSAGRHLHHHQQPGRCFSSAPSAGTLFAAPVFRDCSLAGAQI